MARKPKKEKGIFYEFKKFITRGNIIDLAVGVIIGGAFSAIVTALTNKIIMPLINLVIYYTTGGKGINLITILNGEPQFVIQDGAEVANAKCIYIDWGAFITAIIDFLLIAFILFLIIKTMMSAQSIVKKGINSKPTKQEKAELKAKGVNLRDYKARTAALKELRESKLPPEAPHSPSKEELLQAILDEIKKQNEAKTK